MQRETSTATLADNIRRLEARARSSEAGIACLERLRLLRQQAPPMPWHLRARRAITLWLFAWRRQQDDAFVAELRRQVSEIRARDLGKP